MYKIMDYKYYARVIRRIDTKTRTATHKLLIYKDQTTFFLTPDCNQISCYVNEIFFQFYFMHLIE